MILSYQTEQLLLYPVEIVFGFFADPGNLPLLMPGWQKARLTNASIVPPPPHPETRLAPGTTAAGVGSKLTLSFRPFPAAPFRVTWLAEISEFVWNDHFCDCQVRGPFAQWDHRHSFRTVIHQGIPGTIVTDRVEYALPFGFAGHIANRLFLRGMIESTFAYRQRQIDSIFKPAAS